MWFDQTREISRWDEGIRHLVASDRIMKKIIAQVGPCTLDARRDYFVILCKSIFNQQISTKVASVLFARFVTLFPRKRPTPKLVLQLIAGDAEVFRAYGLSRQKHVYIADLARHFHEGLIPTSRLARMTDDEIVEVLTAVKGVGRWTAEMFLMFTMNRPDVWPVDDLGIQMAVMNAYGMKTRPTAKALRDFGHEWRPWRTLASWYLWRWQGLQQKPAKGTAG
jgi:DNA-3-methyladenine glycosylase II